LDKKTKSINFWMLELFFRLPLPLLQMSRATVSPTMSTSIKKSLPVIFTGRPRIRNLQGCYNSIPQFVGKRVLSKVKTELIGAGVPAPCLEKRV